MYEIEYHPDIPKDIARFPNSIKNQIKKAIEKKLLSDPLHYGDPLRKSLAGYRKLRVGDYRIIYKIKKNVITILKIGHRKEVCQQTQGRILGK